MFDIIKDYVSPKSFSILAFICLIIHLNCGVIFTAITTGLRMSEMEKFNCAINTNSTAVKTYAEKTCFSKYDNIYNSPVRFHAFVFFSFASVVVVNVIYSLAVSSRIDETERDSNRRNEPQTQTVAEKGNNEPGTKTFYVFNFYIFHLLARSVFGILSTILQYTVLYSNGFDKRFSCVYPTLEQPYTNITRAKSASISQSTVTCENQTASDKQFWAKVVSVFNVIIALLAMAEVIYLIPHRFQNFKSLSDVAWSCDSEFIITHFLRKKYVRGKNEKTQVRVVVEKRPHVREVLELTGPEISTLHSRLVYEQKVLKHSLTPDMNFGQIDTSLDDMFTDVVIQTEQAPHKFSKHMKRHEIYDVYMKVPEHSIHLKQIKDLFHPNKDTKAKYPRTILTLGRPGIGKTVLTKKIMRDWANGIDEFYRGKIAFFFKFRYWFDFDMLRNLTLRKFLQLATELEEHEFESIFTEILNNSQNAILIFDGLDELGKNLDKFPDFLAQSRMLPNKPTCSMSAIFLFIKIMFGDLLRGATILVTSRPTAVNIYSMLNFDRKVEIIGFTSDKIEVYVDKFCANHNKADLKPKIWDHITSSSELKNLCYIPVNSFIVCGTLVNYLSDQTDENTLPTTLTKLYQLALSYFKKNHDRNENINEECYKKLIKGLQKLAFDGIEDNRLIFGTGELTDERMKGLGLLHCLPAPFPEIETHVCFIHLTVQEFLAAKHVVETYEFECVKEFISTHVKYGRWHLVLQFLAGLLGRKYKMCALAFSVCFSNAVADKHVLHLISPDVILGVKCVRETEDEEIARKTTANSALKNVTRVVHDLNYLSPSDLTAILFVCKHLELLTNLFYTGILNFDNLLKVKMLLQEKCLKTLIFYLSRIGDSGVQYVLSAVMQHKCHMSDEQCHLAELILPGNNISKDGVLHLCEFLKKGHGRSLKVLNLRSNSINSATLTMLCEVLGSGVCNQLISLNFSHNDICDDGVLAPFKVLKEKQFQLRELYIEKCSLTGKCLSSLVHVLGDEHCGINELSLACNDIHVDAFKLFNVLKKEQCKVTTLNLSECMLTDECIPILCESLQDKNCMLVELDLRRNSLTDKHLSLLSRTLRLEHCCLKHLRIHDNNITEEGKMLLQEAEESEYCTARGLQIFT